MLIEHGAIVNFIDKVCVMLNNIRILDVIQSASYCLYATVDGSFFAFWCQWVYMSKNRGCEIIVTKRSWCQSTHRSTIVACVHVYWDLIVNISLYIGWAKQHCSNISMLLWIFGHCSAASVLWCRPKPSEQGTYFLPSLLSVSVKTPFQICVWVGGEWTAARQT